jgi:hypothetical protein
VPAAAEEARRLSRALNGLVLVLIKLGVHELADGVSRKAIAVAAAHGTAMERLVHELNRIRLQLSWALRLERGGRPAAAATRFLGAAESARAAGVLWSDALDRTPEGGPRPLDHPVGLRARPAQRRPPRRARRRGRHRATSPTTASSSPSPRPGA